MERDEAGSYFFPLTKKGRCPFLNEHNLCDIYSELGEDSLCRVCAEYPRYYRELGEYEQIDISLSCPHAASVFFADKGPVTWKRLDSHEAESEDPELADRRAELLDLRDAAIGILQGGTSVPLLRDRLREIESRCPQVLDEPAGDIVTVLKGLEVMDERWDKVMEHLTVRPGLEALEWFETEFADVRRDSLERWFTKLAVYFVYRYTLDAYEDGDIAAEFRLLNRSLRCVMAMCVSRWAEEDRHFTVEDMADVAHLYSREIEHSEVNLAKMKGIIIP